MTDSGRTSAPGDYSPVTMSIYLSLYLYVPTKNDRTGRGDYDPSIAHYRCSYHFKEVGNILFNCSQSFVFEVI